MRADRDHGNRWRSDGFRRDLERDDWDKLYDRLGVSVPEAPDVHRASSESSN